MCVSWPFVCGVLCASFVVDVGLDFVDKAMEFSKAHRFVQLVILHLRGPLVGDWLCAGACVDIGIDVVRKAVELCKAHLFVELF